MWYQPSKKTFSYDNCWWRWFKFVVLVFWKFRTMYVIVWKWLWIFPYVRRKACVGYVCLRHLGEGWEQAFNTFHRFIETAQICTKVLVLGHLDMISHHFNHFKNFHFLHCIGTVLTLTAWVDKSCWRSKPNAPFPTVTVCAVEIANWYVGPKTFFYLCEKNLLRD